MGGSNVVPLRAAPDEDLTRKLAEVNGQLSFGPPKSAAGRRIIGLPTFVARSLAVHIDLYAEPGDEGLVFPAVEGGPMRRSNFRRRVWERQRLRSA